jgi:YfiH family protein
MLEVLQDPSLKEIACVEHGFFTRLGGVSTGILASLNCALHSRDEEEAVEENLRRAISHFGRPLTALATVRNVHGNQAVIMEKPLPKFQLPQADAMVTQVPGVILGSDSADCPIVLFADETAKVVGLAHAGWKGARSGILESTVEKMLSLGAQTQHISAAISPCIGPASYEVSQEFYQQFLAQDGNNGGYFKNATKAGHFYFDLPAFVKDRLLRLNLKTVSSAVAHDTYTDEKRFFSCRRATHRLEPYFGGQLSCIFMKESP